MMGLWHHAAVFHGGKHMKVILHYDAGPGLKDRLEVFKNQGLDISIIPVADVGGFEHALGTCDMLWHVLEPVTADHMAKALHLRLIQKIGVGVNTIDLEAAKSRAIEVCNMPSTNTQGVVEQTLLLMLSALRLAPYMDQRTRAGNGWNFEAKLQDCLSELSGKTVGLVGYGEIPTRLTPILIAMGAKVIYTATSPKTVNNTTFCQLNDLLSQSDILSLHIPLTPETDKLINASALAQMKRGAVLINTARGGVVDQNALVEALKSGQLSAAGLDVFDQEPVDPNSPILALDNVVLSPHIGWLTREALGRSFVVAAENCMRLKDVRDLLHRVF